jgi:hypothetical protein
MRFARLAPCSAVLLACFGCSDPVPPTPQAAFSVTFLDDGPEGSQGCAVTGHNTTLGDVTPTTKDKLLKNNVEGADVDCSVTGSGSFNLDLSAFQGANGLILSVGGLKSRGSGGPTREAPAPGTVTFHSATTVDVYSSSGAACNFFFADESNQDVAAGRVWLSFNCPLIVDGSSQCELGDSYAIFENCTGTAEED